MKRITPWFLVAPLLGSLLGGCNFLSTGARTAYVVMERAGSAETVSPVIYRSALDQTKLLLDAKHLWVTDDVRGAKWLAVFEISPGSDPAQPAALTLSRLERNPSWDPAAVSSPSPFREPPMHPSLSLAEANQQSRQYDSGR